MKKINFRSQTAKILSFNKGFLATYLINIGNETGIFEALKNNKKGLTVNELATKLPLYEPYVKVWCNTAYFFEILDYDNENRFKFQPFLDKILGDKSDFRNMLSFINLMISVFGERMKVAPELFKTGKKVTDFTPQHSDLVAKSTKRVHILMKNFISQDSRNTHIKQKLDQGIEYLDIGCGDGDFIIQLASMFKNSKFIGIDADNHGIKMATKAITELNLGNQISVECLNGQDIQYNNRFGIVSLVAILHELPPDIRLNIVEKAYQALKNDGVLIIFDFSYPEKIEDLRNPDYEQAIIHQFIDMLIDTKVLTARKLDEILTDIGFKEIRRVNFQGINIITALK